VKPVTYPSAAVASIAADAKRSQDELSQRLRCAMHGRMVTVLSNFNGQPWGHSRPPLSGKQREVTNTLVDGGRLFVLLNGTLAYCPVEEVVLVERPQ